MIKKIYQIKDRVLNHLLDRVPLEELKKRGLTVGENVNIQHGTIIDHTHCWLITIGNNVTIAPRAHILAHDASTYNHLGYTKIGLVSIGDNTFIGAGSIILPGVSIGKNVIVGAGSVVSKNVEDGQIVTGNPAKVIGQTDVFAERHRLLIKDKPVYESEGWRYEFGISEENKEIMKKALKDGNGYVK